MSDSKPSKSGSKKRKAQAVVSSIVDDIIADIMAKYGQAEERLVVMPVGHYSSRSLMMQNIMPLVLQDKELVSELAKYARELEVEIASLQKDNAKRQELASENKTLIDTITRKRSLIAKQKAKVSTLKEKNVGLAQELAIAHEDMDVSSKRGAAKDDVIVDLQQAKSALQTRLRRLTATKAAPTKAAAVNNSKADAEAMTEAEAEAIVLWTSPSSDSEAQQQCIIRGLRESGSKSERDLENARKQLKQIRSAFDTFERNMPGLQWLRGYHNFRHSLLLLRQAIGVETQLVFVQVPSSSTHWAHVDHTQPSSETSTCTDLQLSNTTSNAIGDTWRPLTDIQAFEECQHDHECVMPHENRLSPALTAPSLFPSLSALADVSEL